MKTPGGRNITTNGIFGCKYKEKPPSGKHGDSDKGIYSFKFFKMSIITIRITYHLYSFLPLFLASVMFSAKPFNPYKITIQVIYLYRKDISVEILVLPWLGLGWSVPNT